MTIRALALGIITILAAGTLIAVLTLSTEDIPFLAPAGDNSASNRTASPRSLEEGEGGAAADAEIGAPNDAGAADPHDHDFPEVLEIGEIAPDFELPRLYGGIFSLRAHRGEVVLINFWATWCEPCRDEMPDLQQLWEAYRSDGLRVVGVSLDEGDRSLIEEFHQTFPVEYPLLLDGRPVAAEYGAEHFVPSTFVVGRDGRILDRHIGAITRESFEERIEAVL